MGITKSDIAALFRSLPDEFLVYSFGDNRKLRRGAKNFVDNVIIHEKGFLFFIEIKMVSTKDGFSKGQLLTRQFLRACERLTKGIVKYRLVDEFNYLEIKKEIEDCVINYTDNLI